MSTSTERHVSPHVRACLTGDSGVLMDVQHDRVYSLDRVGTTIWSQFAAGEPPEAIASDIAIRYGAPGPVVRQDVLRFLERLEEKGLVVRGETLLNDAQTASTHVDGVAVPEMRAAPAPGAIGLLARSLWQLLRVDLQLRFLGFEHLHRFVADHPTRGLPYKEHTVAAVCRSVDRACAIYPRQALCLQRSAAATCLLRDQGVPATLVVGTRKHPFRAHAWVEVGGAVVNDKRGVKDYYQELDRF